MTRKPTEPQKDVNESSAAGGGGLLVQDRPLTPTGLDDLRISQMADIDDLLSAVGSGSMRNELPYDLREKRTNVLAYMKHHVKVPISQRKRMVRTLEKRLNRQVSIKSDEEFYNAFFDFVEERPSSLLYARSQGIDVLARLNGGFFLSGSDFSLRFGKRHFLPRPLSIKIHES